MHYFDHNATTAVSDRVREAMLPWLAEGLGNAGALYRAGQEAAHALERARARVAALAGCRGTEVVFTSGGTEADNHALVGTWLALPPERRAGGRTPHLVISAVEHPAVMEAARAMEDRGWTDLTVVEVDRSGRLDAERVLDAITDDTFLVSVMWANNETGAIHPVREIFAGCRARGVPFHTDAVQVAGKRPLHDGDDGPPADLLSLSAHKLHGPKGVGALIVRRGTRIRPLIVGGGQEWNLRSGTVPVSQAIGMGEACAAAAEAVDAGAWDRVRALRDRLEAGLLESCDGAEVTCADIERLPNTAHLTFPYIEGEAALLLLDARGIACSTGSACAAGDQEPSPVITAMGFPRERVFGSLRFSLGLDTTDADVDAVLEHLPPIVERLRKITAG